jgi:hypothetical protein
MQAVYHPFADMSNHSEQKAKIQGQIEQPFEAFTSYYY